MKLKSKIFTFVAAVMITAQLLTACAPAIQAPSQEPTQPPESAPSSLPEATEPSTAPTAAESTSKTDPLVFQQAMRKLWEDHITWTRIYIIDVAADLPETDTSAERLLQNQVDIGDAIKPFYGNEAGNQLTTLLKEHITGAVDLLAAAKAGDSAQLETAKTSWYDNANQIAAFLSTANPENWPQSEMEGMMKSHLDLTLEEATARLNGDWTGDVAAYDEVHTQILDMAAMLTEGIAAQFG